MQKISEISVCFFFKKDFILGETKWSVENKPCKILDCCSRDVLNFEFLEKGLGIVSPPHFVNDFQEKCFHVIFY